MSFLFIASPATFRNICSHWTCIPRNYHEYDQHLPSQGDDGCRGCCFDSGRAVESNPTTRSATGEARGVPLWVTRCGWICESSSYWIWRWQLMRKVRYNYSRSTCESCQSSICWICQGRGLPAMGHSVVVSCLSSEPPSGAWLACAENPFGCSEAEVETLGHPKWCKVMEGFGLPRHLYKVGRSAWYGDMMVICFVCM